MPSQQNYAHQLLLAGIGTIVLIIGVIFFFVPPALFPDPAIGFQALRSMQMGGGFNNLVSPDQGDISKNYTQFLTWWSPGQYLVPYFFEWVTGLNLGRSITITVTLAELCGLAGFYCFFIRIGFTRNVAAISLLFIICQRAFMIPHIYYNGGEILLFAFEGWFLLGCVSVKETGIKLVIWVMFSGFAGFLLKSSFLWIYGAGLCCIYAALCGFCKTRWTHQGVLPLIKRGLWIALPTVITFITIYLFFIAKGESPVTVTSGFKFTATALGYPVASPILSGFSVDDLFNGLIDHTGPPFFSDDGSAVLVTIIALLSIMLMLAVLRYVSNSVYRLYLLVFYILGVLFFGLSYWRQADVSMESRHFRIIGTLIVPGIIYWVNTLQIKYRVLLALLVAGIACNSLNYLVTGYKANSRMAKGITGIAQQNTDQATLNYVMKLDRKKKNLTFVFMGDDIGLEVLHNRFIPLQPFIEGVKFNLDDYNYGGHAGPLYIVLPVSYKGVKQQLILNSFTGYQNFMPFQLSKQYVLYTAR